MDIWRNDKFLNHSVDMDQYDIISFDVFDTLIFRKCYSPSDVFEEVGKRISASCPEWIYHPSAYKYLRMGAEQRARAKKGSHIDCTFEEIFNELPFHESIKSDLARIETECEKDMQFLNRNVYSFLVNASDKGKRVVIVSNMYFSAKQILDFLISAGADAHLISKVYVSSEQGCYKDSGALFERMLSDHPSVSPQRVLHIGDNEKADILGSKKSGITSVHYSVMNHTFGSVYDFEQLKYRVYLGELYSLRRLATANNPFLEENERFFYDFGAEVIAPVYTAFAEWLIRYINKRGINRVIAFMREGELLSKLINLTAQAYGFDIVSVPTFISRQPCFIASFYEDNYAERLSQVLLRQGRSVTSLFHDLGLNIFDTPFGEYGSVILSELSSSAIDEIEFYLNSSKVQQSVLSYSTEQRQYLLSYFDSITAEQNCVTVDIGTKGTTECYLNEILKRERNIQIPAALIMGSGLCNAENILNGLDINAWLGIAGENDDLISKLKYQIQVIETFVNATCGSVLRYEKKGEAVIPVLEQETVSETQKSSVSACWMGILSYHSLWLSLTQKDTRAVDLLLAKKMDFLNIWLRFIEHPSAEEAKHFANLQYFDSYNSHTFMPLVSDEYSGIGDEESIINFISSELTKGAYWPQASVALGAPDYGVDQLLHGTDDPAIKAIVSIVRKIKKSGLTSGVVFGASELGRKFIAISELFGLSISCCVDSNIALHHSYLGGLPIVRLVEIVNPPDYFVIASYIYANEIRKMIGDRYADMKKKPTIFDFGGLYIQ